MYGYSILFTCLGLWLIFYWEGSGAGAANDRWLLVLAYLFGLGGGVHLLCLLTIPSLMLLAWFADRQLQRLIVLLVGLGVVSGLGLVALGPGAQSNGVMVLGLAGLLAYPARPRPTAVCPPTRRPRAVRAGLFHLWRVVHSLWLESGHRRERSRNLVGVLGVSQSRAIRHREHAYYHADGAGEPHLSVLGTNR